MGDWQTIRTGLLIGTLAAIAISSFIALFQLDSGASWKELLAVWGKMLLLTIPALASSTAAALLVRLDRRRATPPKKTEQPSAAETPQAPEIMLPAKHLSLSEEVVLNAREQAEWYYEWNIEPTRRAFEEQGVSQTIWNSGRHILTTAKIVKGNEWARVGWSQIEQALSGIHAEPDRVWIRPLGERTMVCLHINERATDKRHTWPEPPTPPVGESEY